MSGKRDGKVSRIDETIVRVVQEHPDGISYNDLAKLVMEKLTAEGEAPNPSTVNTRINDINRDGRIGKPQRAWYVPAEASEPTCEVPEPTTYYETDYYEPLAEWLEAEGEATTAMKLGGKVLGSKWGTPDVIGVRKPLSDHIVKFEPEYLAVEIKDDGASPVEAFGQAVSYRLFAHRSYMVLPRSATKDDLERVEALALLFGLGLILMDTNPSEPNFEVRVRAVATRPDMYFLNKVADRLREQNKTVFRELF